MLGWAYRVASVCQRPFHLRDPRLTEMEQAGGEHGVGTGFDRGSEVLERAGSAAGHHRYVDDSADGADHWQVETRLGAVGIHRVQQDLARAELSRLGCPGHGVDAGAAPATMRRHLESRVAALRSVRAPGIDGDDHALRAEPGAHLGKQLGPLDGRRIHRDLVGTCPQQPVHVVGRSNAAADGERYEYLVGRAPEYLIHGLATLARRGDVEEHEFIGAVRVVGGGKLDRVAGVAQPAEVDALDHPARLYVQAGNNANRQAHPRASGTTLTARPP